MPIDRETQHLPPPDNCSEMLRVETELLRERLRQYDDYIIGLEVDFCYAQDRGHTDEMFMISAERGMGLKDREDEMFKTITCEFGSLMIRVCRSHTRRMSTEEELICTIAYIRKYWKELQDNINVAVDDERDRRYRPYDQTIIMNPKNVLRDTLKMCRFLLSEEKKKMG